MKATIGKLLKENNMPDTPTARAIYRKMLEPDATPPAAQRPWVGLTDDQLDEIAVIARRGNLHDLRIAIEAKLKDKNT